MLLHWHPPGSVALAITVVFFAVCLGRDGARCQAKVFGRCELAKQLRTRFGFSVEEVANWVCIAEHSSGLNSGAYARGLAGGSHGLFQISDVYWCSPPGKGFACNVPCERLRDDDLTDDMACVRIIYAEHQRISGNGYTAWNAYDQYCRQSTQSYIAGCFANEQSGVTAGTRNQYRNYQSQPSNALAVYTNTINEYTPKKQGKTYNKCELAQELYFKHKIPMGEIATWVCIAQHESNFDTSAVGRLNADGSADHGLFQISDLYWCSHDRFGGGKACGLSCNKLLDQDITDDVRCIRRIHEEHTRISGDGFTAWTVYNPHCRNQYYEHVSHCFNQKSQLPKSYAVPQTLSRLAHTTPTHQYRQYQSNPFLKHVQAQPHYTSFSSHSSAPAHAHVSTHTHTHAPAPATHNHVPHKPHKGKVYNRCELAQELYFKHKFPMQDIATWVCIAEHESSFDTAAVGRLNGDGSADHGLFQVSDLYWCTHDSFGGKGCGLPCHKLLDTDLTDDIKCIRTIHDEHTRISGDGFTAWTVYNRDCRNRPYSVSDCFDEKTQKDVVTKAGAATGGSNSIGKHGTRDRSQGKVYGECELAQELLMQHGFPLDQIATWVCIAQHESSYNTAAVGRLNADGSADHGLFQISDLYWCSHDHHGGKACNIPCHKLLDSDITDDVKCIRTIYDEHTRISGDGFNAWAVYKPHCRGQKWSRVSKCFGDDFNITDVTATIMPPRTDTAPGTGKVFKKCELARELYFKHKMPMDQVPTWVCIAQHESNYDTAAVGRLNTDGSADHGLFQVSDLYWCSHDHNGGKACNIPCHKLLDNDITDDVSCIKTIFDEHTRISGDGFTAWTVYKPHCQHQKIDSIAKCFDNKDLEHTTTVGATNVPTTILPKKRRIYNRCELAQELYFKHKMPMWQVPVWVCIAQHESSFDTSAVGRLNTDGSADHGLFQISDLYWCSHDHKGGKACNIPCEKLLDADITDDVRCINIIYEEHTRISGDGFTAWTVYKRHCRDQHLEKVKTCFDSDVLKKAEREVPITVKPKHKHSETPSKSTFNHIADYDVKSLSPKGPLNHPFVGNPFLNKLNATHRITATTISSTKTPITIHPKTPSHGVGPASNYIHNPFLKKLIGKGQLSDKGGQIHQSIPVAFTSNSDKVNGGQRESPSQSATKADYSLNPFLSGFVKTKVSPLHEYAPQVAKPNSQRISIPEVQDTSFAHNPFLSKFSGVGAAAHSKDAPSTKTASIASAVLQQQQQPPTSTIVKSSKATKTTERPYQHNPFLLNALPDATKPVIRPTPPAMQAPKPNNYLNSDTFRHTTGTTTKPTRFNEIPSATISTPHKYVKTTILPKATSPQFSFNNYNFNNNIPRTSHTTPLPRTKPTATNVSKVVVKPHPTKKFTTGTAMTTERPTYATTLSSGVKATPTKRPLHASIAPITKSTHPAPRTTSQATAKPYTFSTNKSEQPPSQTQDTLRRNPTVKPAIRFEHLKINNSTKVIAKNTGSYKVPTAKATTTLVTNFPTTTTTTAANRPSTFETFAFPATKPYKQTPAQRPYLPTTTKTTTRTKNTTKKPVTTTKKYTQVQQTPWTTTRKPKPDKWSYDWADYFFRNNKTKTTTITKTKTATAKPLIVDTNKPISTTKPSLRTATTKNPSTTAYLKAYNRPTTTIKTTNKPYIPSSPKTTTKRPAKSSGQATTRQPATSRLSTPRKTIATSTTIPTSKSNSTSRTVQTRTPITRTNTDKKSITTKKPYPPSATHPSSNPPSHINRRVDQTTNHTTKPNNTNKTNSYTTVSEYEKYRKDPFSHPFFAKYNQEFELLFGSRKNGTTNTRRP